MAESLYDSASMAYAKNPGQLPPNEQERALAAQYRADALACAFTWQRTQAVLERIAERYERDAAREDQGAEQRDWT